MLTILNGDSVMAKNLSLHNARRWHTRLRQTSFLRIPVCVDEWIYADQHVILALGLHQDQSVGGTLPGETS